MRKNKSSKQNSVCRGNGSKGKQISIELDARYKAKPSIDRYENETDQHNITQRLNYSSNWQQNPMISQNILKEIINYSHLSSSKGKSSKPNTLAIYDKINEDVYKQLSKIHKKSSLGELGLVTKRQKKLTLNSFKDSNENQMLRSIQLQNAMTPLTKSTIEVRQKHQEMRMSEQIYDYSKEKSFSSKREIDYNTIVELEREKQTLAQKMDEVTILQDNICHQFSQMIADWQNLIVCQRNIEKLQGNLAENKENYNYFSKNLQQLNLRLLLVNKDLISSRKKWNEKGFGAKGRILEEAQSAHEQFIKRITVKDFEQTVLFNMKVAIPDHKGRSTVKGIYEELFQSHSTKKFTMILKKHSSHMDLYDGKLLADFAKKINDLQTQFIKADSESTQHPDEQFLEKINTIIIEIERNREEIKKKETFIHKFSSQLEKQRQNYKSCESNIHNLIDEINHQVRGEYVKQTEKNADFKILLLSKYNGKYRQYRTLHEKKQKLSIQTKELQKKMQISRSPFL